MLGRQLRQQRHPNLQPHTSSGSGHACSSTSSQPCAFSTGHSQGITWASRLAVSDAHDAQGPLPHLPELHAAARGAQSTPWCLITRWQASLCRPHLCQVAVQQQADLHS